MKNCQEFEIRLQKLKSLLEDARAILEWHKLKVFESNTNPSSRLFFQDNTLGQLIDKNAAFQSLWIKTNLLLQNKGIKLSRSQIAGYQKELNKLYLRFYYLGSNVRIY